MPALRDVRRSLLAVAVLAALSPGMASAGKAGKKIRIGIALPPGNAAKGATLAAEEARQAAGLLHVSLEIGPAAPTDRIRIVETTPAKDLPILILTVAEPDGPVRPRLFHVASSRRGARQVDWRPDLERFGAEQLNQRFRRRFGIPMDEPAWRGWMAVKIAAELILRAPASSDPTATLATMTFDGHKGEQLFFDPKDHHLLGKQGREGQQGRQRIPGSAVPGVPGVPAVPPPGFLAWVSNERAGTVTVIDTSTDKVVANLKLGFRPRGIEVSPDGRRVYVALSDTARNTQGAGDAIVALDAATRQVVARYAAGTDPERFAISRDGSRLYAANEDAGTATITDLKKRKVLTALVVGIEPEGVALSPDGRWVYITAETSNTVSVIDTRTERVVASFLVDPRPRAAAFSPDGRRAYVTAEIGGTVSVVDTVRHQVVRSIPIPGAHPVGVVVSPDGKRVYVANGHGNAVAVLDAASGRLLASIPVGKRPWGIAVTPDGRKIYTANGVSNNVSVIDAATLRLVATIPAGDGAWGVAIGR
jgi:PQQ-dependent catabolism-associated beta-propeller protein